MAAPARGDGRLVRVDPERVMRWIAGFAERHGETCVTAEQDVVRVHAADGCRAELYPPPFPAGAAPHLESLADLVALAQRPRRLGLLLARKAAIAVGVVEGDRLTVSKVDTYYVQGRTAAGGWSQQRFARRRDNQARAALAAFADVAARVLLPELAHLEALVTGGDRRTVNALLADPRLAPLAAKRAERFLAVGEPRRATLENAVAEARAIFVQVWERAEIH